MDESWSQKETVRAVTIYRFPLKDKICEICESKAEQRHHYTRPYDWDKFIFICKKCHLNIHQNNTEINVNLHNQKIPIRPIKWRVKHCKGYNS